MTPANRPGLFLACIVLAGVLALGSIWMLYEGRDVLGYAGLALMLVVATIGRSFRRPPGG